MGAHLAREPQRVRDAPPYQLRLAISAVTDEPLSGKNATGNTANAAALLTTARIVQARELMEFKNNVSRKILRRERNRPLIEWINP
jgi:hypothetical protein